MTFNEVELISSKKGGDMENKNLKKRNNILKECDNLIDTSDMMIYYLSIINDIQKIDNSTFFNAHHNATQ